MKRSLFIRKIAALVLLVVSAAVGNAQTAEQWKTLKGDVNIYIANDLGRNGRYDQKPIAELMGVMAETIGPECVVAAGDVHHFDGVASVCDPLWMTNFETIYSHPELMLAWHPLLGNHEYRGNTQAVLDYSKVSRRWEMSSRYYTKVIEDDGTTLRLVFIDTTPLIAKYRNDVEKYPDAGKQNADEQIEWIDSVLSEAKEDWVVVVGHHPIYAQTAKDEEERSDMQRQLLPIFRRHGNVSLYVCGHIHNFQHICVDGDKTDYVVNSSASLSRKVSPTAGTVFCSDKTGFSVVAATKQQLCLYMIDKEGRVIHSVTKTAAK